MNTAKFYRALAIIGFVLFAITIGQSVLAAWSGPTAAPPNGNTPAPINVSDTAQSKTGNLTIGTDLNSAVGNLQVNRNAGILGSLYLGASNGLFKLAGTGGSTFIESGTSGGSGSAAPLYFTNMNAANISAPWLSIVPIQPPLGNGSVANVGIGTNAPSEKLQVSGGNVALDYGKGVVVPGFNRTNLLKIGSANRDMVTFGIPGNSGAAPAYGDYKFTQGNIYADGDICSFFGTSQQKCLSSAGGGTGGTGGTNYWAAVGSDIVNNNIGNVGIGGNPGSSNKLDVAGNINATGNISTSRNITANYIEASGNIGNVRATNDITAGRNVVGQYVQGAKVTGDQLCIGSACRNDWLPVGTLCGQYVENLSGGNMKSGGFSCQDPVTKIDYSPKDGCPPGFTRMREFTTENLLGTDLARVWVCAYGNPYVYQ